MPSNKYVLIGIGVLIGVFVLPMVLSAIGGIGASASGAVKGQ